MNTSYKRYYEPCIHKQLGISLFVGSLATFIVLNNKSIIDIPNRIHKNKDSNKIRTNRNERSLLSLLGL